MHTILTSVWKLMMFKTSATINALVSLSLDPESINLGLRSKSGRVKDHLGVKTSEADRDAAKMERKTYGTGKKRRETRRSRFCSVGTIHWR